MNDDIRKETDRRRTFAIISHPDAGKTTLTEKLLLYAGAIHIAGSVKARKASHYATSDWMEIEKQRGISVASAVMQMVYRDHVINLLDTPGHKDFSEDTYRVLTAVDAALMVIDAANGVEAQTLRLLQVCRARGVPIITFINKMDREVRDPLDIVDEIERVLELPMVPFSWPVGMGKRFRGVIDVTTNRMRVFRPGAAQREDDEVFYALDDPHCQKFTDELSIAQAEFELAVGASTKYDRQAFLAGKQTPVFFGSAINNFGVREVLDALIDLAPEPGERLTIQRPVEPTEASFSGVVFKIQANMDPAHRDRIAFVRVCSGRFERGMKLKVCRNDRSMRASNVVSFLSQQREQLDVAYPGDIVGLPNHGQLQLGDTLTEHETLQFTGLPFFAPELFHTVEIADPMKVKQLRIGLKQLGEEGVIQVFTPHDGSHMLLGAIGRLQFEVVVHRLADEYNVPARLVPARFQAARWITADDKSKLDQFMQAYSDRIYFDAVGAPVLVIRHHPELKLAQEKWVDIQFHALREHAGLIFYDQLGAN